jgi:hypothetical protein
MLGFRRHQKNESRNLACSTLVAQHLHQGATVSQLQVYGMNQPYTKITLVPDARKHGTVVDLARLHLCRSDCRVRIAIAIDRLQADQQLVRTAQTHDLLVAVSAMRADLDHAFRDRIQVLARLALHEKYFAMIKLDMLYHTVQRARFFSGREKTIVVPNRLEWAIAVAAWHRSSNPQETI